MAYKRTKGNEIEGLLDIFVADEKGEITACEVLIHGNPEGLKSLAALLLQMGKLNQEAVDNGDLPVGAREHYHLRAGIELSKSSADTIVGRLDAKGTGAYYARFVPK